MGGEEANKAGEDDSACVCVCVGQKEGRTKAVKCRKLQSVDYLWSPYLKKRVILRELRVILALNHIFRICGLKFGYKTKVLKIDHHHQKHPETSSRSIILIPSLVLCQGGIGT